MKKHLIENSIAVLEQGLTLLARIETDEIYAEFGGHIRHCLDFFDCLFAGIKSGKADYNKRERDLQVEMKRAAAISKIEKTIENLRKIEIENLDREILIRHERVEEIEENAWSRSSVARELEFMQSHTVHHYAIVALKLSFAGFAVESDFGVAASTLKYRQKGI